MGVASTSASIFSRPAAKVQKTEVKILLETELKDRVKEMKILLKEKTGCYFSIGKICELAIENALKQAEREINKADDEGDEITML